MNIKIVFGRIIPMALIVLIELSLYIALFLWVASVFVWVEMVIHFLGILVVLNIVRTTRHLSSDMMWIFLILVFPVTGTLIYLISGANLIFGKTFRAIIIEQFNAKKYLKQEENVIKEIKEKNQNYTSTMSFIPNQGYPFYKNRSFAYYAPGENGFPIMLEEMKKAKKYIFMEYFIIEEGEMWNSILEILISKVKEGVECRVMYDDMGSFHTLPPSYAKKLEGYGIKAVSFNKVSPILNTIMNHRDHRKIMVIDGEVAFSGGINLADEYINQKIVHGHWMDNITKVTGEAVWSYLVIFLINWNALRHEDESYEIYKTDCNFGDMYDGYIAPYAQTPMNTELTAKQIYEDILNNANEYVYIMSPYLIIDTEMINTLIHTAKKGVDVKIIMPGIADKKIVHDIGTSYYAQLIDGGVKIYEYMPGFVHSKVFISDDKYATVGTINLDYRSLYLHFENGTFLYDCSKIQDVKDNFQDVLSKCKEIKIKDTHTNFIKGFFISVIRIFASML